MAALGLVWAHATIDPAAGRRSRTFPLLLKYRASDLPQELCTHLHPITMPLTTMTPGSKSKVQSHLTVDDLANKARPLLGTLSLALL